ncbi:hypothetical protein AAMO2058_000350700 [Amorphochlora amoebiformis]
MRVPRARRSARERILEARTVFSLVAGIRGRSRMDFPGGGFGVGRFNTDLSDEIRVSPTDTDSDIYGTRNKLSRVGHKRFEKTTYDFVPEEEELDSDYHQGVDHLIPDDLKKIGFETTKKVEEENVRIAISDDDVKELENRFNPIRQFEQVDDSIPHNLLPPHQRHYNAKKRRRTKHPFLTALPKIYDDEEKFREAEREKDIYRDNPLMEGLDKFARGIEQQRKIIRKERRRNASLTGIEYIPSSTTPSVTTETEKEDSVQLNESYIEAQRLEGYKALALRAKETAPKIGVTEGDTHSGSPSDSLESLMAIVVCWIMTQILPISPTQMSVREGEKKPKRNDNSAKAEDMLYKLKILCQTRQKEKAKPLLDELLDLQRRKKLNILHEKLGLRAANNLYMWDYSNKFMKQMNRTEALTWWLLPGEEDVKPEPSRMRRGSRGSSDVRSWQQLW